MTIGADAELFPIVCCLSAIVYASFAGVRVLICPDKFKGTLSALKVCLAVARGVRREFPDAEVELLPIADGGEGTVEAFCTATGGRMVTCPTHDPLGREVEAFFGELPDGRAVVELAAASGLHLIASAERDPWRSNSFGTGEVMLEATGYRPRQLLVGLGGSATNDAGVGMAAALGFRFLDDVGREVTPIPVHFRSIARIVPPQEWKLPECVVLCDVSNPLNGPDGATYVYGPQKGVRPEECAELDAALQHVAEIVKRDLQVDVAEAPGAGAAGGLGFGMMAFARASARPGFEVIAEITDLRKKIAAADLVITGEGKLDWQSLSGKGPCGVAAIARGFGKTVICLPGSCSEEPAVEERFDGIFPLVRPGTTLEEAIGGAAELLELRAVEAVRDFRRA